MIARNFSEIWSTVAPAAGNHLWQSTLFATMAGLLTLVLRKHRARTRYWVWLAASLKFLIPFSLLIGMGSHLGRSHPHARASDGLYHSIEQLSQPFARSARTVTSYVSPLTGSASASLMRLLPALVAALWLCGFLTLLFVWGMRWRRMSVVMRDAMPMREGREIEALRRLEQTSGIHRTVEMFLSRAYLEPAIFGVVRPVLVWPEGISDQLEDKQIEAILAHELCHARLRDNLSAAMHMVVNAIFWFHPMVWWMGVRLAEERECACDEEVLEFVIDGQLYAEAILKVCEFCVGSALACVSGVTGADLKKRIVHIMTEQAARKLNFSKKLLLGATGLALITVPVLFGVARATPSPTYSDVQDTSASPLEFKFEVATIKANKSGGFGGGMSVLGRGPTTNQYAATNVTLMDLIRQAYGIEVGFEGDNGLISGAPSWVNSEKYDIQAKMDSTVADGLQRLSPEQRRLELQRMLQILLVDRLKLTTHRETKQLPVYALVVSKNGPKLKESKPVDPALSGAKPNYVYGRPGTITISGAPMESLAQRLSLLLNRVVLDRTGLTGKYDVALQFTLDESQSAGRAAFDERDPNNNGPNLFTAIQEQLGLKLEPTKGPVEIIVIDHVERPTGN